MSGPDEPTQSTPEGARIPIPKRGDVMRDLRKVAKADEGDQAEAEDDDAEDRE